MKAKKNLFYLSFLILLSVFSGCAYKNRELYQPLPITVSSSRANVTAEQIRTALRSYEWIIEKDVPGEITARQMRRVHQARVKISYNRSQVAIRYLDSSNLNYTIGKDGKPHIHTRYNTWVQNLERRIASSVN